MEFEEARKLLQFEMMHHGLFAKGWIYKFDNRKIRFGNCNYKTKTIGLSLPLTLLNTREEVRDTILHEIAHALVGIGHNHGKVWRKKAIEIGCSGKRCYTNDVKRPYKYQYQCPNCKRLVPYNRRPRESACGICCRQLNNGQWTNRFKLVPID